MTEAEIMQQMTAHGARIWSLLQYWTSVSFAVLIAAYLTKGRVSRLVVGVFLVFYAGFSLIILEMYSFDNAMIRGGFAALEALSESGAVLSPLGQSFLENGPLRNAQWMTLYVFPLTIGGMFVLTLIYPVICLLSAKKAE